MSALFWALSQGQRSMHVQCAGSTCGPPAGGAGGARPREARVFFLFLDLFWGLNSVRLENFGSFCFLRCSTFNAFFECVHFYDVVLAAL